VSLVFVSGCGVIALFAGVCEGDTKSPRNDTERRYGMAFTFQLHGLRPAGALPRCLTTCKERPGDKACPHASENIAESRLQSCGHTSWARNFAALASRRRI